MCCYNFNQGIAPCTIAMLEVVRLLEQVNTASGTWYVVLDMARVLFNPYHEGRTKAGNFLHRKHRNTYTISLHVYSPLLCDNIVHRNMAHLDISHITVVHTIDDIMQISSDEYKISSTLNVLV